MTTFPLAATNPPPPPLPTKPPRYKHNSSMASAAPFTLSMVATNASDYAGAVGTSGPIHPDASADELSQAITEMVWNDQAQGLELGREDFEVFKFTNASLEGKHASWLLRLYPVQGHAMLKLTSGGRFAPLVATVPPAGVVPPVTTTVAVKVLNSGHVPTSAMPVSATSVAASAGAAKVAAVEVEAAAAPEVISVAPVLHKCGDGILTTNEGCDDGAKTAGDGCSRNCTIGTRALVPPPSNTTTHHPPATQLLRFQRLAGSVTSSSARPPPASSPPCPSSVLPSIRRVRSRRVRTRL